MIHQADPIKRLHALKKYMAFWIDNYPTCAWSFETFLHKRYSHIIPGTVEYAKSIATHCYYCNRQFTSEKSFKASVDHYLPRSIGNTERFVICCVDCNCRKSDISPDILVSKMVTAHLRGKEMWGYHGKKLKRIYEAIETITNDMLYDMGPRIYYYKR